MLGAESFFCSLELMEFSAVTNILIRIFILHFSNVSSGVFHFCPFRATFVRVEDWHQLVICQVFVRVDLLYSDRLVGGKRSVALRWYLLDTRKTEISDAEIRSSSTVELDKEVLWLKIPMDNKPLMQVLQPLEQLKKVKG